MATITIRIVDDIPTVIGGPLICGNVGYMLTIDHDGSYDGAKRLDIIQHSQSGEERKSTMSVLEGDEFILPAIADCYLLEMAVRTADGSAKTKQPALLHCMASIKDDAGDAETPGMDVYNTIMEYLATGDESTLEALTEHTVPPAFPGAAYTQAIREMGRTTELVAVVNKSRSTEFTLTGDDTPLGGVQISCTAITDDYLLPGGTPAAELIMGVNTVHDPARFSGAELELTFRIQRQNEHWCEVPLGVFTAAGVEEADGSRLDITAYDDMRRLDIIKASGLGFEDGTAYTAQQIIETIAEAAGIDYDGDVSELVNGDEAFIVSKALGSIETARDLMADTMQVLCATAYIDRWRKLIVRPIEKLDPDETIAPAQRFSSRETHLLYRLHRLSTVLTVTADDGTADVTEWSTETLWPDGVDAELPENPLWGAIAALDPKSAAEQALERIAAVLDPVTLYPAETTYPGDPASELMDWKQLTVGRAFPLTEYRWQFHGAEEIRARGFDAVMGIAREQSEKAALAARMTLAGATENAMRNIYLKQIRTFTGLSAFTYRDISHFTYNDLGGRTS